MITGTVFTKKSLLVDSLLYGDEQVVLNNLKVKKSFLYIGSNAELTSKCFSFFDYGVVSNDFEEAKSALYDLNENGGLPDFIVVDQPLKEKDIFHFVLWLHSNKWSFMIPVFYNESALNTEELCLLKKLSVADDIINIEDYCSKLNPGITDSKESNFFQLKSEVSEKSNSIDFNEKTPLGKRLFDIVVSSILIIALLPLLLIISLIIKLESNGSIIYKSKRAGRGFKVFDFYKFRSMVENADQQMDEYSGLNLYADKGNDDFSFFKLKNDPRVTKFGSFLRNTSLDELPQLINVLKGDMSIVGNRPLPLYEASTLTTDRNAERFIAPAGITGLWQVTKRGREDMKAEERIGLDINYARQQGFLLDLRILFMTPLALFQKSNV